MSNLFELMATQQLDVLTVALQPLRKKQAVGSQELLVTNEQGQSLLHAALCTNSLPIFKALLSTKIPLGLQDGDGDSVLHKAVQQGLFHFVDALLSVDAPLNISNKAGITPLQLANQQKEKNENSALIAALLTTRGAWQQKNNGVSNTQTDKPLRFNRVVHLLEEAFPNIEPGRGQKKLLMIGRTGAGKSTLLNYLFGVHYELALDSGSGKLSAHATPGTKEQVNVGMGMISETLYPQVMKKKDLDFAYCDLAGLLDTHGDEERICAASSIQMLSRLPGMIQGIMVVLDLPSFSSRGAAFKDTAIALAKMMKNNSDLFSSICFVITHLPAASLKTITPQGIKEVYVLPLRESLNEKPQEMKNQEELSLQFMLDGMINIPNERLLIANITDQGESCTVLEKTFQSLQPQESSQFDFLNSDPAQQNFNQILETIASDFSHFLAAQEKLPLRIEDQKACLLEQEEKIDQLKLKLSQKQQEKNQPFDFSHLEAEIKQQQSALLKFKEDSLQHRKLLQALNDKKTLAAEALANLNTTEKFPLDEIVERFQKKDKRKQHSVKRDYDHPIVWIEPSVVGYGTVSHQLIRPEPSQNQLGNKKEASIDWDDDAQRGRFEMSFGCSKGLTKIEIKIFTMKKFYHRIEIQQLKENLHAFDEELKKLNQQQERQDSNECILSDALQTNQEVLRAKKSSHATLDLEIAALKNDLSCATAIKDKAQEKLKELEQQYKDACYALLVNEKLFDIVFRIVHVFDFALNKIFNEFIQDYNKQLIHKQRIGEKSKTLSLASSNGQIFSTLFKEEAQHKGVLENTELHRNNLACTC